MRPTTPELLRGLKHGLDTVLLPDLQSPWPKMLAVIMSRLIEHAIVREDELPGALRESNLRLRALLAETRELVARADPDLVADVDAALATPSSADDAGLDALTRESDALRGALEAVVERLPALDDRPDLAELQARIDTHLREELEDDQRFIERLVNA